LEELKSYLSKLGQSDWSLNWVLKPTMLALVQARLLVHPGEKAKLIITSYFNNNLRIVTPSLHFGDMLTKPNLSLQWALNAIYYTPLVVGSGPHYC